MSILFNVTPARLSYVILKNKQIPPDALYSPVMIQMKADAWAGKIALNSVK